MKKKRLVEIRIGREFAKDMAEFVNHPEKLDKEPDNIIYIESLEILSQILSPKRMQILQLLSKKSNLTITTLAKELNRRREAVSRDIHILEFHSLIELDKRGKTIVPKTDIHALLIPITST